MNFITNLFIGDDTDLILLATIILRTFIVFIWLFINIRYLGKRNVAQLSPFEFILVIILGSATGGPIFYAQVPLLHAMAVISTVIILEKAFISLTLSGGPLEIFAEGKPTLVIKEGKVLEKNLKEEGISKSEIMSRLRILGIDNTGKVEIAYLETSGDLGLIQYSKDKAVKGESTLDINESNNEKL